MKEVEINGQRVPFTSMKSDTMMNECKEPNLIGYSKVYYLDGIRYESKTQIKFYK